MFEFGRLLEESLAYINAIQRYMQREYTLREIEKFEGEYRRDAEHKLASDALNDVGTELGGFLTRTGMTSQLQVLETSKGSEFELTVKYDNNKVFTSTKITLGEDTKEDAHLHPPEPTQQPKFNDEDKVDHRTVALLATHEKKWLLSINLKHHMLTLPIGKVHPDEGLISGLCREMWEELGIKLEDVFIGEPSSIPFKTLFKKTYDFAGIPVNIETYVFHIESGDCFSNALWLQAENREPEKCGGLMWVNRDDIRRIAESTGLMLADCVDAALNADMVNVEHVVL